MWLLLALVAWSAPEPDARAMEDEAAALLAEGREAEAVDVLQRLGLVLRDQHEIARASEVLEDAVRRAEGLGDVALLASTRNNLAVVRLEQSRYAEAVALLEASLEGDPSSNTRSNLAVALHFLGDVDGAVAALEAAAADAAAAGDVVEELGHLADLVIVLSEAHRLAAAAEVIATLVPRARAAGLDDLDLATVLQSAARVHLARGELSAAEEALDEVLTLRERALGAENQWVATTLNDLGVVAMDLGQLDRAAERLTRALALRERLHGPRHSATLTTLGNLAWVQFLRGEVSASLSLHDQVIARTEAVMGADSPKLLHALENRALLAHALSDFEDAVADLTRAAAIVETTHGVDSARAGRVQILLGTVLRGSGQHEEALALMQGAVARIEAEAGDGSAELASAYAHLALAANDLGKRTLAREAASRGLDLTARVEVPDPVVVGVAGRLALEDGELDEALDRFQQELELEVAQHGVGHPRAVGPLLRLAEARWARGEQEAARKLVSEALSRTTRALWEVLPQASEQARLSMVAMGQVTLDAAVAIGAESDEALYDAVLAWKGVARQVGVAERSGVPLADVRTTWGDVCATLPRDAVLVDFVLADDPVAHGPQAAFAFVMRGGACDGVERVALGPAAALAAVVGRFVSLLRQRDALPSRLRGAGARAREALIDPLDGALDRANRLVVVPDGALAELSFAALVLDDDRYLLEAYEVVVLDSAADLVRWARSDVVGGEGVVLVGDVPGSREVEDSSRSACVPERGPSLPGARRELDALTAILARRGATVTRLDGARATEAAVGAASRSARVVHLATHGFAPQPGCLPVRAPEDHLWPVHGRSVLAQSGVVLAPGDGGDGLWTSEEVALTDLSASALVVVSSCDSARGEVLGGEGVLGLRRALSYAGAGTLITALWAVPDDETATLMADLYRRLNRHGPAEALRRAQLAALARQRRDGVDHVGDWAAFVCSGPPGQGARPW